MLTLTMKHLFMNDMKIGKVKHMVPILIFRCYEPGSCTGTVYKN